MSDCVEASRAGRSPVGGIRMNEHEETMLKVMIEHFNEKTVKWKLADKNAIEMRRSPSTISANLRSSSPPGAGFAPKRKSPHQN